MYRVLFIDSIPRSYEHQTPIAQSKMTAEHPVDVFDPHKRPIRHRIRNATKTKTKDQSEDPHQSKAHRVSNRISESIEEKDDSAELEREGGEFDRSTDRPEVHVRSFERADHQFTRFRMRWSRTLRLKRHSHVTSASASGAAVSKYTAREARKNRPWEQTNRPSTTGPYSHTSTWEQGASHMGACCIWEERRGERKERKSLSACGFFHTEKRQEV